EDRGERSQDLAREPDARRALAPTRDLARELIVQFLQQRVSVVGWRGEPEECLRPSRRFDRVGHAPVSAARFPSILRSDDTESRIMRAPAGVSCAQRRDRPPWRGSGGSTVKRTSPLSARRPSVAYPE